ncbi:hypothetical protein AeRB84_012154 [Aphanomyces euteiches]|nr:hypothetical protein AeRB84_012154 [Aphanomyces euteiches]
MDANQRLIDAAERGDLAAVRALLTRSNVNSKDSFTRTPLFHASKFGHLDIVRELLDHGAAIDTADKDGWTPLVVASYNNQLSVVKFLLDSGAPIDKVDKDGKAALIFAAEMGHLDIVNELLARGASINMGNKDNWTPLIMASFQGFTNIAKALLAQERQKVDVVQALLDSGASVDFANTIKDGWTALHVASDQNNLIITKTLLDHNASVDIKTQHGETPMHFATKKGFFYIVQELLAHGASPDSKDEYDNTPLHIAALRGDLQIIQLLMKAGADSLLTNQKNETARDLGNDEVKAWFDNYQPKTNALISTTLTENINEGTYSINAAFDVIRQAVVDTKEIPSEIIRSASAIFKMTLEIQIHKESVLSTALTVERIARHLAQQENAMNIPNLTAAFINIEKYWETTLLSTQVWKLLLNDAEEQAKIQAMRAEMHRLQNNLLQAAENLDVDLNIHVVGSIGDMRQDIGNMMVKMQSLGEYLETISNLHDVRQQRDGIIELAIQLQRGLEYYERQVTLGNVLHDVNFENQVKSCQNLIGDSIQEMKDKKKTPKNFGLDMIATWMLSSEDIQFDGNDRASILGQGGFGTVFKGTYHGQAVAVKRFDQILLTDSTDLERSIAKEIKAWKDISHKRYILTLFGVCTKAPTPILVSELCQTNIRRYVRDWPEMLLPMVYQFACGLVSLHEANIIHRDLKGDNVLVTYQNILAIADFGLSRTVESLEETKTGMKRAGTLNWMSPEQYFKPRRVTTKSDVWSFGMTVWEVLTSDTPYRGCSEHEFAEEIFQSEEDRPEKPQDMDPELEPLWTLITKCWQLDPTARPTAVEIVEFLKSQFGSKLAEM